MNRAGWAVAPLLVLVCACSGGADASGSDGAPSTGTGDHGSGGGGAGHGEGGQGGEGAGCAGVAIDASGELDLNVRAVSVSGSVTLKGAPLPTVATGRGAIVFKAASGDATLAVPLGASGAFTYSTTLAPGRYSVAYSPGGTCADDSPLPCNAGTLLASVDLTTDGGLDVDIPAVVLQGNVTLAHGPLPAASADRGSLTFAAKGGVAAATKTFGAQGPASYKVTLLPGAYDVGFAGNVALCAAGSPSGVPCNSGVVQHVDATVSGALDVDLSAVTVQGNVTVNHAVMPTANGDRGALAFTLDGGAPIATSSFGVSGGARYALRLLAGRYRVDFTGNPALCDGAHAPGVPCNTGVVAAAADLAASGSLDVDVPAVTVLGNVTLNGAAMPTASGGRGQIGFAATGSATGIVATLPAAGPATYAVALVAGTYDVSYAGDTSACASGELPPLPCNAGPLKQGVGLAASGSLDLDVGAVTVQGRVTIGGATMPDAAGDRGVLTFAQAGGAAVSSASFGASGAAAYALRLLKGRYDVAYAGNQALCAAGAAKVPCNGATVLTGVDATASGALDVDVPIAVAQGNVTLNGAAMPAGVPRGSLLFQAVHGAGLPLPLVESGPASYGVSLVRGDYVVVHDVQGLTCASGSRIPCIDQVLVGCPAK